MNATRAAPRPAPHPDWIVPPWPAPLRGLITTRAGGVSQGPWGGADGGGMNVGFGADDEVAVVANRARLAAVLPGPPRWLRLVHGAEVVDAERVGAEAPEADAAFTTAPGVVCCVTVADCLPVLLAEVRGRGVAAVHAGWRGLAAGVVQRTVQSLRAAIGDPAAELLAFLGPAIGPHRFEVGAEVLAAMQRHLPQAPAAFVPAGEGKYHADLYALARQALAQAGVGDCAGGGDCTVSQPGRFYSFRRDRVTGRHAALAWIEPAPSTSGPGVRPV